MPFSTLANMCSHLQNSSRVRLGITSVPSTKATLALALALQRQGFISSVVRGGMKPPEMLTATSMPHATSETDIQEAQVTRENVATRRIWLGLKYYNAKPVLREMKMISTSKRSYTLKVPALRRIAQGRTVDQVGGLTRPGECLFVFTDLGLLEVREAIERGVGGRAMCRVY